MNKSHNPTSIQEPYRNLYSHAIEVAASSRLMFISGQYGVRPDGSIGATIEEQGRQILLNIKEILADADMDFESVVKINTYIVRADDVAKFGPIRSEFLGDARPAMTTVVVTALASPDWLIEVEAVAAQSQ